MQQSNEQLLKFYIMKIKKQLIGALLSTTVLFINIVSAQNTINLFVDTIPQSEGPPEEITIGPCDTINLKSKFTILSYFDTAQFISNFNNIGIDCDLLVNPILMSCYLPPNEIFYDYSPQYYYYYRYYDLQPSLTLLITHQFITNLFFVKKPEACGPVNFNAINSEIKTNIFPNPTIEILNISINKKGNYRLKIYNSVGQLITQSAIEMGITSINLKSKNIDPGLYFVEISNEQQHRLKIGKVVVASE